MKTQQKVFIDFAAVKAAVSITQILQHYGLEEQFRQSASSAEWRGPCPIHGGENDSEFSVNTDKNIWNCFSDCGRGGNVLDLVALLEDVDVHSAALLVDEWFELNLARRPKPRQQNKAPARIRKTPEPRKETSDSQASNDSRKSTGDVSASDETAETGANAPLGFELKNLEKNHHYLMDRDVNVEVAEAFGIGYCARGSMAGRIVIPLHNPDGQLLGYIGRWPGDPPEGRSKYKLPAGFKKSLEVFNIHRAKEVAPEAPLIIVEGIFDVLALWQKGIPKCVALLGSSLSPDQESLISRTFSDTRCIALLFDEDDAGRRGREDALQRLARHAYVHVVRLPEEHMQPEHLSGEELAELLSL